MSLTFCIAPFLLPAVLAAQQIPPAASEAAASIGTAEIRAHMEFLADDLLEGRAAGTRGYDLAAAYVASELRKLGLEPAGSDGSFYQQVPFVRSTLVSGSMVIHGPDGAHPLAPLDDFVMQPNPASTVSEVRARVAFVGFGITSPELGWDDYSAVDARGKIAVVLSGAPTQFPATMRAHHASSKQKALNAARHGAVGLITLRGPSAEGRFRWERLRRNSGSPSLHWVGADGKPGRFHPELRGVATLSRSGAESLFTGAPTSLTRVFDLEEKAERPVAFDLPIEVSMRSESSHEKITSPNVAAILPGSDPSLAAQTVVYTAHLDHVGITEPVKGDRINNGAFDNASGIGALLEVAAAFRSLPEPPARSVMFLAVTAEEKGLLGSDYFASQPTIARERIVANVNMDMFIMLFPLNDVIIYGYEHSSLARQVDQATAHMGIDRIPDPTPEEASFVRSDQYSFVRNGIPAIAINEGIEDGDPQLDGDALIKEWLLDRYHTPQDDLQQRIHWETGRDLARLAFLVGYLVAEDPIKPRWNEKDFFGSTYGGGAQTGD